MRDMTIDQGLGDYKTTLISKNITVRLEPEMWLALRDIALREKCTIHDICSLVSVRKNSRTSLTAAIRVFLMLYYRAAATEEGHRKAGHGNFEFMKRRARLAVEALAQKPDKKNNTVQ
ncbi:MAG: ribbon-helix-helix domain-containing protein [Alphaproteobacteria bacterium]